MRRYLTAIFIGLSIVTVFVGFQFDIRWNGIVAWGLSCILLIFAAYFTKYIPNKSKKEDQQGETN